MTNLKVGYLFIRLSWKEKTKNRKESTYLKIIFFKVNILSSIFFNFLLFSLLLTTSSCKSNSFSKPQVVQGTLDVSSYDFIDQGNLQLDGEWDFYREIFLTENQLNSLDTLSKSSLIVPGSWNDKFTKKDQLSSFGYGTYVVKIKGNTNKNLALGILYISTASEIEHQNKIIYQSGRIANASEAHIPYKKPKIVFLENTPQEFKIIIRVSNFTTFDAGLSTVVRLGTREKIITNSEWIHFKDFFTIGSLVILGLYHIFFYIRKRNDKTPLLFGLFCLSNSLRISLAGNNSLLYNTDFYNYYIFLRLEYLTLPLGTYLSSFYITEFMESKKYKKYGFFILVTSLILVGLDLSLPVFYMTNLLIFSHINFILTSIFAITILIHSTLKKQKYSAMLLFSSLSLIVMVLNDLLNRYYIINTVQTVQIGFIFFIFSQSYIIISKYTNQYLESEQNKKISEQMAKNLEIMVSQRTNELHKQSLKVMFQKTEIENMNILIRSLNDDLRMDNIMEKIRKYIMFRFNIDNLILAKIEDRTNILKTEYCNLPQIEDKEILNKIKNFQMNIDEISFIDSILKYKKVYWLKRINLAKSLNQEKFILNLLNCQSIVFIPLFLNKKPIAVLFLFIFNSFKIGKNDMHHLTVIGEQIGGSIYNSWLIEETNRNRDITESALKNLKESQNLLIQAEKMSALSQLVSSIAHEINTPIGAIKASAQNIHKSSESIIQYTPSLLRTLDSTIYELIIKFLTEIDKSSHISTTKEERIAKKNIYNNLVSKNISNALEVSEHLSTLKLTEISDEYLPLWKDPKSSEILKLISDFYGLKQKSKIIESSVDKTSKIIYALKSYTIKDLNGNPVKYNILDGIQSILLIYENQIKQGMDLRVTYEENIPEILCYPDEINQVWTNLIYNAIQATNGRGILEVSIKKKAINRSGDSNFKDGIEVCILDNGGGIPEEIQKKIFDPFFTTKKPGEGTGLGLHICKEIIKKHGGDISFESKQGHTQFLVSLPLENDLKMVNSY